MLKKILKRSEVNKKSQKNKKVMSLLGKCLVSVPGIEDERFDRSVVFICAHSEEGTMGIVINRPLLQARFDEFVSHLNITVDSKKIKYRPSIIYGGPMESTRGFVLHTADYFLASTVQVKEGIAITSTLEILDAIANGKGPSAAMIALGYANWEDEQLEKELKGNNWIIVDADIDLLFEVPFPRRWRKAMQKIGADPAVFSLKQGNA